MEKKRKSLISVFSIHKWLKFWWCCDAKLASLYIVLICFLTDLSLTQKWSDTMWYNVPHKVMCIDPTLTPHYTKTQPHHIIFIDLLTNRMALMPRIQIIKRNLPLIVGWGCITLCSTLKQMSLYSFFSYHMKIYAAYSFIACHMRKTLWKSFMSSIILKTTKVKFSFIQISI